jgi:hypothetical protein
MPRSSYPPALTQIPAERIQAGGETLLSAVHEAPKGKLPDHWKEPIIVAVRKKRPIKLITIIMRTLLIIPLRTGLLEKLTVAQSVTIFFDMFITVLTRVRQ